MEDIDATIDELFEVYSREGRTDLFEEMCPYFGTLWAAGRVLTEQLPKYLARIEERGESLKGSRILEVGCGLALPSLYLEKRGLTVEATDLHPDVPAFLKSNRERNGLKGPRFVELDWRKDLESETRWDLILASDVLYDKTQPASLLDFLLKAVVPGGSVLVADPGRSYFEGFLLEASRHGFHVKTEGLFGVFIGELRRDVLS